MVARREGKLINIRRGESGGAGKGGPLWSPAVVQLEPLAIDEQAVYPPTGDHKGPPHIHPTTLAPTRQSRIAFH